MNKHLVSFLFVAALGLCPLAANAVNTEIGSGALSIAVETLDDGLELTGLRSNGLELLDLTAPRTLFEIDVDGTIRRSTEGWTEVTVEAGPTSCSLVFVGTEMTVTVSILTDGDTSDWDIAIDVAADKTLNTVEFPCLNLKAGGEDVFFLPKYSGVIYPNPQANALDKSLLYPRGFACSMQFASYYNDAYGIYLGTHDPGGAMKYFSAHANGFDGLRYSTEIPIPDKGQTDNDWQMEGVFCVELFDGQWYEASQIYKRWVSAEADYWPRDDADRTARFNELANIDAWVLYWGNSFSPTTRNAINAYASVLGDIRMALHWYLWYSTYSNFDEGFPYLLPEKPGMTEFVADLQGDGHYVIPYMNGRLFQTNHATYPTLGAPNAVKNVDGSVSLDFAFGEHEWATMCPATTPWQDIMVAESSELLNRVDCAAAYFDMICAANPKECYDPNHGHTLAGGNYWRSGYAQMMDAVHTAAMGPEKFITTEGCCDYLADTIDGFLTLGWMTDNMVPAFQSVYGGRVHLAGINLGTNYSTQTFYCKVAQTFVTGIIPGSFSSWMTQDPNAQAVAVPFIRRITTVRKKLREYMARGHILKPLPIDKSSLGTLTTTWHDHEARADVPVTMSTLQSAIWGNAEESEIVILLLNASMTATLNFGVDLTGADYGLLGDLEVQEITETSDGVVFSESNSFSRAVTLEPLGLLAIKIESTGLTPVAENDSRLPFSLLKNQPNPFNPLTTIRFSLLRAAHAELCIYDVMGRKIATVVDADLAAGTHHVEFEAAQLAAGVYFYSLRSNGRTQTRKMLIVK